VANNKNQNKTDEEEKEVSELAVNTQELPPNANTLGQMPNAHTGPVLPKNELRPVSEWKILKKTKEYVHAALLAKMGWRDGKEVSEGDYIKALASLRGTRNG
jgi:hypothetical protein